MEYYTVNTGKRIIAEVAMYTPALNEAFDSESEVIDFIEETNPQLKDLKVDISTDENYTYFEFYWRTIELKEVAADEYFKYHKRYEGLATPASTLEALP